MMAEAAQIAEANAAPPRRGRGRMILLVMAPLLALGGGAGAAFAFVPGLRNTISSMLGSSKSGPAEAERPHFVEIPEMTVTMPNGGRPRQLRIHLALELAKKPQSELGPDILSPRIYDALVLYLRTLRDSDIDGALAIDRMRGDLQRRLDLLLGDGVLRDVLITSLIIS